MFSISQPGATIELAMRRLSRVTAILLSAFASCLPYDAGAQTAPPAFGGWSYGAVAALWALIARPDLFDFGLRESPSSSWGLVTPSFLLKKETAGISRPWPSSNDTLQRRSSNGRR